MVIKFNLKRFIISLLIPIAVGGLSTLITGSDMKIYDEIVRPKLSPPFIVFPIVWSILYILMGISLYLVWNNGDKTKNKTNAYMFFASSLLFNFIWSPIFFSAKLFLLSFIILVLMFMAVLATIIAYKPINKCAAILQVPYLIWLVIAGYLNIAIYILN